MEQRKCNYAGCTNDAVEVVPGGDGNGSPLCREHFWRWLEYALEHTKRKIEQGLRPDD